MFVERMKTETGAHIEIETSGTLSELAINTRREIARAFMTDIEMMQLATMLINACADRRKRNA